MIQRISIYFDTTNGIISGDSIAFNIKSNNQHPNTHILTTNAIPNIITGNPHVSSQLIENAIKSLPNFVIGSSTELDQDKSVTVTSEVITPDRVQYLVTFSTDVVTTTISRPILTCPRIIGCPFAGCRPKYDQLIRIASQISIGTVTGIVANPHQPTTFYTRSNDITHRGTGSTFDVHVRLWIRVETIGNGNKLISVAHLSETGPGGIPINNLLVAPIN